MRIWTLCPSVHALGTCGTQTYYVLWAPSFAFPSALLLGCGFGPGAGGLFGVTLQAEVESRRYTSSRSGWGAALYFFRLLVYLRNSTSAWRVACCGDVESGSLLWRCRDRGTRAIGSLIMTSFAPRKVVDAGWLSQEPAMPHDNVYTCIHPRIINTILSFPNKALWVL